MTLFYLWIISALIVLLILFIINDYFKAIDFDESLFFMFKIYNIRRFLLLPPCDECKYCEKKGSDTFNYNNCLNPRRSVHYEKQYGQKMVRNPFSTEVVRGTRFCKFKHK